MRATFMQRQRFLFIALGLLTLWRWALLPTLELSPEEASLAGAARAGWETDTPVLTALAQAGIAVFGAGEFGVRCFAPLLALLTSLAVWRFTRGVFDPMIAGWAVVLLNVTPAFNLAAVTLTPGTVLFFLTTMAMLCLRIALLHAHPLHWGWLGAAACVVAAVGTAPPGLGLMLGITLSLAWPRRLRHHLRDPGFLTIAIAWLTALGFAFVAQDRNDWPMFDSPTWRPALAIAPNVLRVLLLASPLVVVLLALVRRQVVEKAEHQGRRVMPAAFLLPMAASDLLYGPWGHWPDVGAAAWLVPGAILLAQQGAVYARLTSSQRISLRTIAVVGAALQSAILMQTDLLRSLGIAWPFEHRTPAEASWGTFFVSDPSGTQRGWRESARLLDSALAKAPADRPFFVIAADGRLAAALGWYGNDASPVLRRDETSPRVLPLPGVANFEPKRLAGRDALFVTDDPVATLPPAALVKKFARVELIAVARVMHAGNEVRWLKIFSCHAYRPPES